MTRLTLLLLVLLTGCEGDAIRACSYACQRATTRMESYSPAYGCKSPMVEGKEPSDG